MKKNETKSVETSGNFTNLIYDTESYNESLHQSVAPMSHVLDPTKYINRNRCYSLDTLNSSVAGASAIGNQIDVDSILKGIDKISSKTIKYQNPTTLKNYTTYKLNTCSEENEINTKYSRLTDPATNIKGLTNERLRYSYPKYDPQCNIFENFAVNTQLKAKDNYKAVWQIPLTQSDLVPNRKLGNVVQCKQVNTYASY